MSRLLCRKETHPLVVIDKAAPVQQMHHGLKAEESLLFVVGGLSHSSGCQLDWLVPFSPGKLLQPYLQNDAMVVTVNSKNVEIAMKTPRTNHIDVDTDNGILTMGANSSDVTCAKVVTTVPTMKVKHW